MERDGPGGMGLGVSGRVLCSVYLHNLRPYRMASGHRLFINQPVIVYNIYNTLALSVEGVKVAI